MKPCGRILTLYGGIVASCHAPKRHKGDCDPGPIARRMVWQAREGPPFGYLDLPSGYSLAWTGGHPRHENANRALRADAGPWELGWRAAIATGDVRWPYRPPVPAQGALL